jgi:hypothetical protein
MARTPTVFRWDDPGAPDLNAIMPTNNDKNKLFMHTVLKACLVDGYGNKAAAGWSMPQEEITSGGCRFVLTNAANSGSLLYEGGEFSGGTSLLQANTLWACSSVVDMESPINGWSYNVQYENREAMLGNDFHKSGVFRPDYIDSWVVIANENTAIVVAGKVSSDFNALSSAAPSVNSSAFFVFGALSDSTGFYVSGGSSGAYAGTSRNGGFSVGVLTSNVDILGLSKAAAHGYSYKKPSVDKTYSPLSAWLPFPVIYNQYGPSAPDGDAVNRLHFALVVPAVRKLLLCPGSVTALNDFMVSNGFEYGVEFTYYGSQWVLFKAYDDVVNLVSLDAIEWGV